MNKVILFYNEKFGQVRGIMINNEPYFVGKDVAEVLGYSNTRDALAKHIDDDDKNTVAIHDGTSGNPNVTIINESGLYSLILSSKLPKAKEFKRWVTSEVLPSIRKHGTYMTAEKIEEVLSNPDMIIQLAIKLKQERAEKEKLKIQKQQQNQIIAQLNPKSDYTDTILKSNELVTITQIAKDYGMSGKRFNKILHKLKVQYKQNGQWLLYSKHHAKGYTHSKTIHFEHSDGRPDTKMITEWTQKGRLFLYRLLKQENILPVIEQVS